MKDIHLNLTYIALGLPSPLAIVSACFSNATIPAYSPFNTCNSAKSYFLAVLVPILYSCIAPPLIILSIAVFIRSKVFSASLRQSNAFGLLPENARLGKTSNVPVAIVFVFVVPVFVATA